MASNFISGNDPPVLLNRARLLLFWSEKKKSFPDGKRFARVLSKQECTYVVVKRSG